MLSRRGLIAIASCVALVAGTITFVVVAEPRPAGPTSESVISVASLPVQKGVPSAPLADPQLPSAPAVNLAAATPAPANDLSLPVDYIFWARVPVTGVPISRDANSTLLLNSDGTKSMELSPTPINFQLADGTWVPAESTIAKNSKTGAFSVANNPLSPAFAASLGTAADYTLNDGTYTMSVSLLGASSAKGKQATSSTSLHSLADSLNGKTTDPATALLYANAFPGQDLQYQVSASEVKETLVLNSVPSADSSSWTWLIHAPGLTMSKSDRASLYLTDAEGVVRYSIPEPVMWDSSAGSSTAMPAVESVAYTFAQLGDGDWTLTMTPDRTWLTAKSRVYPVMVDPTVTYGITSYVTYRVGGQIASINYTGRDTSGRNWRTVAYYSYDGMRGSDPANWYYEVTPNSYFYLSRLGGESRVRTGYVAGASCWGFSCIGTSPYTYWELGTGATTGSDAGVSNVYQDAINSNYNGLTVIWVGDEAGVSEKQLSTSLNINYITAPVVTAVTPSPAHGGRGGVMPILAVSATNTAGVAQNFNYRVSTNPNPDVSSAWISGWTASTSVQVPKSYLTPGVTYYWKASVRDAYGAIRSTTVRSFVANTPGTVGQTGSYPAEKSVVTSLTPTLSVPSAGTDANGDSLQYQFRLTTAATRSAGRL